MKRVVRHSIQKQRAGNRRGAIIIIAMIAILLASALCLAMVKTALAERRIAIREQLRVQSSWLAESGAQRAAALLAKNRDYKGETWKVAAKEIGGNDGATVVIAVAADKTHSNRRTVTVTADFPAEGERRSRSRQVISIDLAEPPKKAN